MFYCGLDIVGVSSYVFVTDGQGRKLCSGPVATTKAGLEARLRPFLRGGLAVAIEAGNQTAWIYELLVALGAEVTVVNPTLRQPRRAFRPPSAQPAFGAAPAAAGGAGPPRAEQASNKGGIYGYRAYSRPPAH